MRNFEKIVTKKQRRPYNEQVEYASKQRKKRLRPAKHSNRYGE